MTHQHVSILLVEDDPGHARLIEKNLRRAGLVNTILNLDNGRKALDYLFCEGDYCEARHDLPLLVLLDLNLPVLDGYEVLQRIKEDNRTHKIPVVILTTTDSPHEVQKCYDLGCNIYVTKPVEYDDFSNAIRDLGLFLSIVKIPDT